MTDPHIGRLVYKPTARAHVLKGTRLPLGLKALLSAGTDEQEMRIQKTSRNNIILAGHFLQRNSDSQGLPLPCLITTHHSPLIEPSCWRSHRNGRSQGEK